MLITGVMSSSALFVDFGFLPGVTFCVWFLSCFFSSDEDVNFFTAELFACFLIRLLLDTVDEFVVSSSDVSESDVLDDSTFDDLVLPISKVFRRGLPGANISFESMDCLFED